MRASAKTANPWLAPMAEDGRPKRSLEEKKLAVDLGALYTELNTILARISRRPSGEPKAAELARIEVIRAELRKIRKEGELSG